MTHAFTDDQIRAAARAARDDHGAALLTTDDIAEIVITGNSAILVLTSDKLAYPVLGQLHARLSAALPNTTVEIRAGNRVHRGGAGFGAGKHIVAVLGGK